MLLKAAQTFCHSCSRVVSFSSMVVICLWQTQVRISVWAVLFYKYSHCDIQHCWLLLWRLLTDVWTVSGLCGWVSLITFQWTLRKTKIDLGSPCRYEMLSVKLLRIEIHVFFSCPSLNHRLSATRLNDGCLSQIFSSFGYTSTYILFVTNNVSDLHRAFGPICICMTRHRLFLTKYPFITI